MAAACPGGEDKKRDNNHGGREKEAYKIMHDIFF
jgi:hypothetical protein